MASRPNNAHHSPGQRSSPTPPSALSSPGSILLPPVEINVSPSHSFRSASSAQRGRHPHSEEQPENDGHRDLVDQEGDDSSTVYERTVAMSEADHGSQRLSLRKGTRSEDFSGSLRGDGPPDHGLRRSTSNRSITVHERGWFGRLRRSPNFILFTVFLALFIDMATYGIIVPIIPFIVSDKINGGATDTGLLLAMYAIGLLLSSPLFGVLGDSFVSRRIPMLIGLVGMLVSTILFMFATNFYIFLLARLLQGVAGGSVWTLGLALITDVFPAETLGVQMGKALVGYTLGLMMGPPLGGILYERGGYQAPFLFCCIITLIDFACRALIIEEREEIVKALREQGKQDEATEEVAEVVALRKKERQDQSTSFWKLLKNKRLVGCVLVTACNSFVFSGAEPTVPLHLARTFDLTSERIGLVFMAFSLPTLTAPLSGALSDRFGAKVIGLISLVLCGGAVIAAGIYQNSLPMIVFLFTIIGTTGTAILTPILGELSAVVRETGSGDGFARAYAMFNMAFSIGVLIGPVVCGIVFERFGFWVMCLTMGGTLFLAIPVVALWIGGAEQKKKDLAKYKEDEEYRFNRGSRLSLSRSRYSIDFMGKNEEEGTATQAASEGDAQEKGQAKSPAPRGDILKSARMDE